jgi:hypothetical protein
MLIYHQLVVLIFVCFRSKVLLTLIFYFYLFANDPPMALEKALNECQKAGYFFFSYRFSRALRAMHIVLLDRIEGWWKYIGESPS